MLRLRRYRLFLVLAVLTVISIYHFAHISNWDGEALEALVGLKHEPNKETISGSDSPAEPFPVPVPLPQEPRPPTVTPAHPALPPTDHDEGQTLEQSPDETSTTRLNPPIPTPSVITGEELLAKQLGAEDEFGEHGQGRYEVKPRPAEEGRAIWRQQVEHFPVPSLSLIPLPTGVPKALPKIQYTFGRESSKKKSDRVRKQTTVREAFKHAWFGYKNHSLPHDELKPLSKEVGDPFNGWGATLVDSLDTLWIMGLREEFQEAVSAVGKINFKTSPRKDIPLFETTIRYLGGLVGAYDVSAGKYPVLLDKAVELADILMGAFDTPNRIPAVFYNWAPSYASQPHRANVHSVLAEIGSLSVEFTRLAQITKENKYYDAIARITDALEKWQTQTTLPGLWPLKLDASGCKKPELLQDAETGQEVLPVAPARPQARNQDTPPDTDPVAGRSVGPDGDHNNAFVRRQVAFDPVEDGDERLENSGPPSVNAKVPPVNNEEWEEDYASVDCEPQGLNTEPHSSVHAYGIGAMADSTYEYFPKEFALLGGLNSQYKSLYLDSMDVVRRELLFRPMTKDNRDILFLAKQNIEPKAKDPSKKKVTVYEGTHLGCFAGGMFALGSKLFGLPSDMTIAEKLTNGCVWSYGSTHVGVMPEEFELVPCDSLSSCKWNETKWHEALDPRLDERIRAVELYNLQQQRLYDESYASSNQLERHNDEKGVDEASLDHNIDKRDSFADLDVEDQSSRPTTDFEEDVSSSHAAEKPAPFVPRVALSHEKYVAARIQEERLPPGYTRIKARDYRLRPEAIESVFIMYRITGDEAWREKGWTMFEAVDRATMTEVAHGGIRDVTSQLMEQQDTMESFWLAETLKYYYLLFSDPELISLDDYVLNTEAHPFRRPK